MWLETKAAVLERGRRRVVDEVTVGAGPGEFIALVGPNGAGKSSLLLMLAGLAKPTQGSVQLDGRVLGAWPSDALARRRAYLPQNPRCDWPIPVERLVALGLTPTLPTFGDFGPDDGARIDAALASMDLESQRHQAATTLSGGELARAMLARALVGDPAVILVDEPLAGLDPRHAIDTARRLRGLADQGRLVIAAIHDLNLALRHATRLWALREGKLVVDGAPDVVLDAALIGKLFDVGARIATADGSRYVEFT
ncbi:MAG: ABC transporter ATP-binding protein [Steroidobacteraceae bacterium]